MTLIDQKAKQVFPDTIIRKDLVVKLREKVNFPAYIVENVLLKYSDGDLEKADFDAVSELFKERIVNPKESLILQSKIRDDGSRILIDKVMAKSITGQNKYWAELLSLSAKKVQISNQLIRLYPTLLENGIWAEVKVRYLGSEATQDSEFMIEEITPFQLTNYFNLGSYIDKVKEFTPPQWLTFLLRSIGIEPLILSPRKKLLFLSRLIPFVEKNYNLIELGARGTGKSYTYRQLSSESILISGGKTTVANLFYNMGTRQLGLVGKWDVVAFDEVAYVDFDDKTAIQILKDYMESGVFSRGRGEVLAEASMVFLGNFNHDVNTLVARSHLFEPLPELMKDMALIDRFHFYLPGWEMNKLKEVDFTTHYGLQSDYLAMAMSKLRELDFTDMIDEHFLFDDNMNARDKRAVRKTVSGFIKLLHPSGEVSKEEIRQYVDVALEGRKRVKEQLVKMGSFEYEDTAFEYIDRITEQHHFPIMPEDQVESGYKRKLAEPGMVFIGQVMEDTDFALLQLKVSARPGIGKLLFVGHVDAKHQKDMRKTFIILRDRKAHLHLKHYLESYDFYVETTAVLKQVEADISNAFFLAIYSLIMNKSISTGLLVTERSSIYRKANFQDVINALKVEGENGQVKTLLPLERDHIFVEVPREVIARVPYFIKV